MAKASRRVGSEVVAVFGRCGAGLRLTVRARATRRRIAVVEGSAEFVERALVALGLGAPPAVASLAKDRHGARLPLVRRKPANGDL